jgi:competence protein ComEC
MITPNLPPAWRDLQSLPRLLFFRLGGCALLGSIAGDLLLGHPASLTVPGATILLAVAWRCLSPGPSNLPVWLFLSSLFALNLITRTPGADPAETAVTPPREAILGIKITQLSANGEINASPARGRGTVVQADPPFTEWLGKSLLLSFIPFNELPAEGSVWEITGVLEAFSPAAGEIYPWVRHHYRRGISGRLARGRGEVLAPPNDWTLFWHALRQASVERLHGPTGERRLLAALLLGHRSSLNSEQILILRETGTLHFFAISGLHMGFIAGMLILLGRLVRLPRQGVGGLVLAGLLFYLSLIGAPPSAVRAVLMVSCFLLAGWLSRPSAPILGLGLSAGLTLLIWPAQWWDLGFRLSHLVVAAILLYAEPLRWYLQPGLRRKPGTLPRVGFSQAQKTLTFTFGLICVGLASFLASTPLLVETQGVAAWSGILLNFPLYALILGALGIGLAGLISSSLLPWPLLWEPFLWTSQWLLETALALAGLMHAWEGSRIIASWPAPVWSSLLTLSMIISWCWPVRPGRIVPILKLGFPFVVVTGALLFL